MGAPVFSQSAAASPALDGALVTPSDSLDLPVWAKALYVGVAGDVTIDTARGTQLLFKAHPVGYMPVQVKRVYASGTTATNIIALTA